MRMILAGLALWLTACGSAPTGPTPLPPVPVTLTATVSLTDTVSGAAIGSSTQTVPAFPAQLTFLMPGYIQRQTWVRSASASVDLIPEAGFDLGFYRQLARNGYEAPGSLEPLRLLSVSPSIYVQTTGLSGATVKALEQAARATIPAMTGGRLGLGNWETGDSIRTQAQGWIVVELISDESANCGRALIGAAAGHVWLNTVQRCRRDGALISGPSLFAHELGHALGFWHIAEAGLMHTPTPPDVVPSARERSHAAIAYARQSGNRDVDVDP